MKAPFKCPMCGSSNWKQVDQQRKGFSVGKAAVGGILLGPVGLLGGALGKKKVYYCCGNCGFEHEYNGWLYHAQSTNRFKKITFNW